MKQLQVLGLYSVGLNLELGLCHSKTNLSDIDADYSK